jgi:hypothetical protein
MNREPFPHKNPVNGAGSREATQKQELLDKARLIRPHLLPKRRPLLDTWIADEETYEERRARFGRRSAI